MAVVCVTEDAQTFTANAYLVDGPEPTLVDVGAMPGVAEAVTEYVDRVDSVVITHQDADHVAELDAIREAFDPTIAAFEPIGSDTVLLEDGDAVQIGTDTFEVVHTPGHADDHVAFVNGTTLFSGDVVVYNDGAFQDGSFGRTDRPGQDRETLIRSLRTLLDRLPETVEHLYAGHGDPFHGDVRAVIERALSRAERRESKYPDE